MSTEPYGEGISPSRSKASALIHCRCPKCREGRMFPHPITSFKHFAEMNTECPICKQDFRIEPGFYFGASYFSYAFNVIFIILFGLVYFFGFPEYSEWYLIGAILVFTITVIPLNYRYSRTFMLHLFGGVQS